MVTLKNSAQLNETELENVTRQYNEFIQGYIEESEIISAEITSTLEMGDRRYAKVVTLAKIAQSETNPSYSDFFQL